jgi:ribosomal protein S18 acetylase RimI-like enzyme
MSRAFTCASTSFASLGRDAAVARARGRSAPSIANPRSAPRKRAGSRRARLAAASARATAEARLALQSAFERADMPLSGGGAVTVRALRGEDVRRVVEVMLEAFKGTPDERPRARVAKYLVDRCAPDPDQVCLVGVLDGDPVSVASLSFTEEARGFPNGVNGPDAASGSRSIPCPPDAAYLCNVAVDVSQRGRGIAKSVLLAAEALALEMGHDTLWLHVRTSDPVAFGLYQGAGYEVFAREDDKNGGSFLGALFGSRGGDETRDVALMRKTLLTVS